jgi:hypothetical protein
MDQTKGRLALDKYGPSKPTAATSFIPHGLAAQQQGRAKDGNGEFPVTYVAQGEERSSNSCYIGSLTHACIEY